MDTQELADRYLRLREEAEPKLRKIIEKARAEHKKTDGDVEIQKELNEKISRLTYYVGCIISGVDEIFKKRYDADPKLIQEIINPIGELNDELRKLL